MTQADARDSTNVVAFHRPTAPVPQVPPNELQAMVLAAVVATMSKKQRKAAAKGLKASMEGARNDIRRATAAAALSIMGGI